MKTSCLDCKSIDIISDIYLQNPSPTSTPKCLNCGGTLRPKVIWFGESLDQKILISSFSRLKETDLLIVAGTSAVVYPVAEFPYYAKRHNPELKIIEFNIEKTPISNIATETYLGSIEETIEKFLSDFGSN